MKGPDYKEKFSFVFGDGLVTSVGDKHKGDRALFAKYFTQKKIETHLPILCKQTLIAIEAVGEDVLLSAFWGGIDRATAPLVCSQPPNQTQTDGPNLPCYLYSYIPLQEMEPHANGEVVNLEHFFSVLSLKMFCRYAIDYEFPDSGKGVRLRSTPGVDGCVNGLAHPPSSLACLQTCGAS